MGTFCFIFSCIGHCVLSTIDHIHDQNCSTWEVYNNDASHIVSAAMNGYHGWFYLFMVSYLRYFFDVFCVFFIAHRYDGQVLTFC